MIMPDLYHNTTSSLYNHILFGCIAYFYNAFIVGCPVLKKTLSYRVWVNGITHG
jgi:hypothetical protein